MKEEDMEMLGKWTALTYGSQDEINDIAKDKNTIISVIILKPMDCINEEIIEYYRQELKSIGIDPTWDENLWGFKAGIKGELINKLREEEFIVLLDRKIKINIF